MASLSSDTLDVERGVQQRTLKIEQRQNKKFVEICFAAAVISVVSAMIGYYAAVHSVSSANTHPDHGIDHNTAFKLDRAIAKAFHVTASVRSSQQAPAVSRISGVYPRNAGRANIKMESAKAAEFMEIVKGMTLVEVNELRKEIEEKFDVSSAGGVAVMAPGAAVAGGGADAPAEEEKTEFDVTLESFPAEKKIAVMKEVRAIAGLGLMEAKKLVESAPFSIKEGISKSMAEDLKKKLEEAGAVVTIK